MDYIIILIVILMAYTLYKNRDNDGGGNKSCG